MARPVEGHRQVGDPSLHVTRHVARAAKGTPSKTIETRRFIGGMPIKAEACIVPQMLTGASPSDGRYTPRCALQGGTKDSPMKHAPFMAAAIVFLLTLATPAEPLKLDVEADPIGSPSRRLRVRPDRPRRRRTTPSPWLS